MWTNVRKYTKNGKDREHVINASNKKKKVGESMWIDEEKEAEQA